MLTVAEEETILRGRMAGKVLESLGEIALVYGAHPDFRDEWRP